MIDDWRPIVGEGWRLIAPADAVPGDSILLPGGRIEMLGQAMFEAYGTEVRRMSWAIRRIE